MYGVSSLLKTKILTQVCVCVCVCVCVFVCVTPYSTVISIKDKQSVVYTQ